MTAAPWPPPIHADPNAKRPPCLRRRSAWSRWIVMRVPVAARGWPIAIAPPSTLVLERSRPSSRSTARDRKSTRLNSSHGSSSYAVFCLKKHILGGDGRHRDGGRVLCGPLGERDRSGPQRAHD